MVDWTQAGLRTLFELELHVIWQMHGLCNGIATTSFRISALRLRIHLAVNLRFLGSPSRLLTCAALCPAGTTAGVTFQGTLNGAAEDALRPGAPKATPPSPIIFWRLGGGLYSTAAQGDSTMSLDARLMRKIFDSTRSQSSWGGRAKTIGPR